MNRFALIAVLAACVLYGLGWFAKTDADAMRACQERHSFDTCHHTLYR